jgi:lipopolysaccharide export system protein LptC
MLMGILALGTYWLVRSTPVYESAQVQRLLRHEADYFMQNFSVRTFAPSGRIKNQIFGIEAKHYPDTDILEIEQIRWTSVDANEQQITASADHALTNSDVSEVQMSGHAIVRREATKNGSARPAAAMSLEGEFFHVFLDTGKIKSHKPIELTFDNNQFTANSMELDLFEQVLQMRGRVRGVLQSASSH